MKNENYFYLPRQYCRFWADVKIQKENPYDDHTRCWRLYFKMKMFIFPLETENDYLVEKRMV